VLVPRVHLGLPGALGGIDDDAARAVAKQVAAADSALRALANDEYIGAWRAMWAKVVDSDTTHPLLAGYGQRLLYDAKSQSFDRLRVELASALSPGREAIFSAAWIEGFLASGGAILIHDEALRDLLDDWVRSIADAQFIQVLPLLRRTFATFPHAERRMLGEKIRVRGGGAAAASPHDSSDVGAQSEFDAEAAAAVLPLLKLIWGPRESERTDG
jgi:Family of unknown function (DUF5682)